MKLVLSANIIRLLILGLFLSPIFALAQDQPDRENTSDDSSAKALTLKGGNVFVHLNVYPKH